MGASGDLRHEEVKQAINGLEASPSKTDCSNNFGADAPASTKSSGRKEWHTHAEKQRATEIKKL